MDSNTFPEIYEFTLRGNYPNFYNINYFIRNRGQNNDIKEGFLPPEIEYKETKNSSPVVLNADFTDIPYLCQEDSARAKKYLSILIAATRGNIYAKEKLNYYRNQYLNDKKWAFRNIDLKENEYVVHSGSTIDYDASVISHKGKNLLSLIRQGYPVPDFSILTTNWYSAKKSKKEENLKLAISNLEQMTGNMLDDKNDPLIIAIRCAMPQYIPGLMPTYLNAGVVKNTTSKLIKLYGLKVAGKIYLDNLITLYSLLYHKKEIPHLREILYTENTSRIYKQINSYYNLIYKQDKKLLSNPFYQIRFLLSAAVEFFEDNKELPFTLLKRKSYPSFILQKMVWTIRDENSYPGVLYSRHSRTGLGYQIESKRNIFGVDIMSGDIETNDTEYFDREEIKAQYPEVYHFTPLLKNLEDNFSSPVTIEFAAESFKNTHLFAILQINKSELTGRASLLSAIDLYNNHKINKETVIKLVKPYHLRQIFSETIDQKSLSELICFSEGVSILPRSAITAKIYFSAENVIKAKKRGEKVCFCKKRFVPADTAIMKEVDAIISMHPAAIHVVTACKGFGIPAFLNMEKFGAKIKSNTLVNNRDVVIKEGEWVTMSSKRKMIYIGKADFTPARFQLFLEGKNLNLNEKEEKVFANLKAAYKQYTKIVNNLNSNEITNLNDLIKFIQIDLAKNESKAIEFINNWYDKNKNYYVKQILKSPLGSHLEQHRIYNYLSIDRKINFFKKAIVNCMNEGLKGFEAGSFMLGRFLNIQHPVLFWKAFNPKEILFMLNEYILFEKYMSALNDIGERKINRLKKKILTEGLQNIIVNKSNAQIFVTLKLAFKNWEDIFSKNKSEIESETYVLIDFLKKKYGELYIYNAPWSIDSLKDICKNEKIKIPDEDSI